MSDRKPVVLDRSTGKTVELRRSDDLDIPLNERVEQLERNQKALIQSLMLNGIELNEDILI